MASKRGKKEDSGESSSPTKLDDNEVDDKNVDFDDKNKSLLKTTMIGIPPKESANLEATTSDNHVLNEKDLDLDAMEDGKAKVIPTSNSNEQDAQQNKLKYDYNNPDVELVVARPVPDDDGAGNGIPHDVKKLDIKQVATLAHEYDPNDDKKNSICRRHAWIIGGGVVLGIALIVLLIVLVSPSKAECNGTGTTCETNELSVTSAPTTSAPTISPTTRTREVIIIDYLATKFSPEVFDEGTPHSMALDWILNRDLLQLKVNLERDLKRLSQRFALAAFYFSSTQTSPWRSCNPSSISFPDVPISTARSNDSMNQSIDLCTYLKPKRGPDGSSIVFEEVREQNRWLSDVNECEWPGVNCTPENEILGIDVRGQAITGNLGRILKGDTSNILLKGCPSLRDIDLSFNNLTGTIPASFADFPSLLKLQLYGNSLTGKIPMSFFVKLTSLELLNLGENLLSGRLDTNIGRLTELRGLHLHQNNFEGQFPSEIGKLSNSLEYSRINGNEFSGPLPTEIGELTSLVEFQYSNNIFTGTIPTQFGKLTRLKIFQLNDNLLAGTFPVELCNLTNLQAIVLDRNTLTGSLPTTELVELQQLQLFRVSNNRLTGPIPSQLGGLPRLMLAWLHLNEFTGEMPNEVCELAGIQSLQADCAPFENSANPCRCCSACCDRSNGVCLKA